MLKYEAPFEYYILMDGKDSENIFYAPTVDDVINVAKLSPNPVFLKPKFMRYLKEYSVKGIYCGRAKLMTPERREYYRNMWQKNIYELAKDYKETFKERERRITLLKRFRGELGQ